MNQDDLKAITTIVASPSFERDRLWLNGMCVELRRVRAGRARVRRAASVGCCAHASGSHLTHAPHPRSLHSHPPSAAACSEEDISRNGRVQTVLREIRARAGDRADASGTVVPAATLAGYKVHIVSRNTFPTAAGLASSAAGYACLVHTLADVFAVKETFPGEWAAARAETVPA